MMKDGILTEADHSFRDFAQRTKALRKHISDLCTQLSSLCEAQ